jgi:hypothetical protein
VPEKQQRTVYRATCFGLPESTSPNPQTDAHHYGSSDPFDIAAEFHSKQNRRLLKRDANGVNVTIAMRPLQVSLTEALCRFDDVLQQRRTLCYIELQTTHAVNEFLRIISPDAVGYFKPADGPNKKPSSKAKNVTHV